MDELNVNIGLDVDGVLADFSPHYLSWFNLDPTPPTDWDDHRFREPSRWEDIENNHDFWLSIPINEDPKKLEFKPFCYITARSIPSRVTEEWLINNGFPKAPVVSVGRGVMKSKYAHSMGIKYFIDDSYENHSELTAAGIRNLLYTREHNVKYENVKDMRVTTLKEAFHKIKRIENEKTAI